MRWIQILDVTFRCMKVNRCLMGSQLPWPAKPCQQNQSHAWNCAVLRLDQKYHNLLILQFYRRLRGVLGLVKMLVIDPFCHHGSFHGFISVALNSKYTATIVKRPMILVQMQRVLKLIQHFLLLASVTEKKLLNDLKSMSLHMHTETHQQLLEACKLISFFSNWNKANLNKEPN